MRRRGYVRRLYREEKHQLFIPSGNFGAVSASGDNARFPLRPSFNGKPSG